MTADKMAQTWFSYEKLFTVQTPTNTENDRIYAAVSNKRDVPPERLLKGRKHFCQSILVSVALSKHGKTSLVFVDRGAKVNSSYYCDYVLGGNGLLRDIRRLSGNHFIFQQDGAPAHRSRQTVAFLTANVPEFIEPENWPTNSPDLNSVDYCIWGALQQLVYRQKIRDLDHLKRALTSCWEQINQELMDKAIDQWMDRISLVIWAKGWHIEQHLN